MDESGTQVIDRPSPGVGYTILVLCLGGGAVAFLVAIAYHSLATGGGGVLERVATVGFVLLVAVPVALVIQAEFATQYSVRDGELRLRSGIVIHATIPLSDIERVEEVGFVPRVLGWGGGYGLANRLTHGLRLVRRSNGAVYYFTPSDASRFREILAATRSPEDEGPG